MADDLRAGIEALRARSMRTNGDYSRAIYAVDADALDALLAAHPVQDDCLDTLPIRERDAWVAATLRFMRDRGYTITAPGSSVQDEGAARAYFGEGYEFALIHLDDEPVQADLARIRPNRPGVTP